MSEVGARGALAAYLKRLRADLRASPDVDEVLAEVEDHLRSVAEAHTALGLSTEDAERHAVAAFGSPDLIAKAFTDARGKGAAVPTMLTRAAGVAAMIGGAVSGTAFALASIRSLDVGGTTSWFAPLAAAGAMMTLIGFVGIHVRHRAVYSRSGRWGQWLALAGPVAVVVSVLFWFIPGGIVGLIAIAAGLGLIGRDVWLAGVLDRRALALVGAGLPAALAAGSVGGGTDGAAIAGIVCFGLFGGGVAWLGAGLWLESVAAASGRTAS